MKPERISSETPGFLDSWLLDSFHIWKVNIRRHSGAETIVVARQTDLHAEYLLIRSATVCTLRGVNSACRLICSTTPSKSVCGNESTRTRTCSPNLIKPSHDSGT